MASLTYSLQNTYLAARAQAIDFHYIFAADRVLEVADGVLGLDFDELTLDKLEILPDLGNLDRVLGGDVGVAKEHQVIDLVAGVEQETAHGGVRNLLIHKGYRTMMETD